MTMKLFYLPKKITFSLLILFLFTNFTLAQKVNAPRQESLLNGLKVLMWNTPTADDRVMVKLRIHKGSAFDRQDREGTMALLGDILFPNEQFRDFFTEDLGGSLEVTSNYDYIQINITGDKDKFLTILETLANAVSKPEITKETTAKVRADRLELVKGLEKDQVYIADQAARKRLLGDYPYGRPQNGDSESLAKIDFADILYAKQRFLSSDNATLAIVGDLKTDFVIRAVRRYFGSWTKSDNKIPATFTQPEKPDEKSFNIQTEYGEDSQVRYAMRGVARSDSDFHASQILTKVLQNRLQKQILPNYGKDIFVRQDARFLSSVIFFGYTSTPVPIVAAPPNPKTGKVENTVNLIMNGEITAEEFNKAKSNYLSELAKNDFIENWFDIDTYKLSSYKDESKKPENVTLNDVNRTLERLRKEPIVSVSVMKRPNVTEEKIDKDKQDKLDDRLIKQIP